jgi:hypothetical protein
MYRCENEKCKYQSSPGETMFKIYEYVEKTRGRDIKSEKKVCVNCYRRSNILK